MNYIDRTWKRKRTFDILQNLIYELCGSSTSLPFVVSGQFLNPIVFSRFQTRLFICLLGFCVVNNITLHNKSFSFVPFDFSKTFKSCSRTKSFNENCCRKLIYVVIANHSKHHSIPQFNLNCFPLSLFSIAKLLSTFFPLSEGMDFNHK